MEAVIRDSVDPEIHEDTIRNVAGNLEIWASDPANCVHLVACTESDEIVGVVLVKEFWNLSSLFVLPSSQGNGLGRSLVLAALEVCKSRSPIRAVHLNSAPRAVGFYSSLGFVQREPSRPLPAGFVAMRLSFSEA